MTTMIRFFCSIDHSPLGRVSLAYADAFMTLGVPVRLIATRHADLAAALNPRSPWSRHRGAFLCPMVGPFVNIVCGEPDDWRRLYTSGVKNVLIASEPPSEMDVAMGLAVPMTVRTPSDDSDNSYLKVVVEQPEPEQAIRVALQYQVVVTPTGEISRRWEALGAKAVVVPTDLAQHLRELRTALFS